MNTLETIQVNAYGLMQVERECASTKHCKPLSDVSNEFLKRFTGNTYGNFLREVGDESLINVSKPCIRSVEKLEVCKGVYTKKNGMRFKERVWRDRLAMHW